MMTRLYSYVCALRVCVYSSTYCKDSGYIRVTAISYVPLNTLLKYSLQLLV